MHQRYFECNYGPGNCPLDRWFGTFRERIEPKRAGDKQQAADDHVAVVTDARATIVGLPDASYMAYLTLAVLAPLGLLYHHLAAPGGSAAATALSAHAVALAVSVGPVLAAVLLQVLAAPAQALSEPRKVLVAPFHKEGVFGALGLHLLVSSLVTVVPAYHAVHTCLAPFGDSAFCVLRGGC